MKLIIAVVNAICSQQHKTSGCSFNGLVSVLIPARNEEDKIALLLGDLQRQTYQNIEIIVFNDLSTDRTEEIILKVANGDPKVKLISSKGLPQGWLGKNFACHSLSQYANGQYLLFIDADVRLKENVIADAIALAQRYQVDLLSVFPKQKMNSIGEWLTVPNMNYILLTLLPLVLVRTMKFSSLAAANGQFMLFKQADYTDTKPHEVFKNNKVEDVEIARFFKQNNKSVACVVSNGDIECRMYNGFSEAVNGFSKNVISFFGNSFGIAMLYWFFTCFGFVFVLIALKPIVLYLFLMVIVLTRMIISGISKQNVLFNLLLAVPQQFALGLFIYRALINTVYKKFEWKGRRIS